MKKQRSPLQVSDKFKEKLEELQRRIMLKKGEKKSFVDLTNALVSSDIFSNIEKQILNQGDIDINFKIKFDRRFK